MSRALDIRNLISSGFAVGMSQEAKLKMGGLDAILNASPKTPQRWNTGSLELSHNQGLCCAGWNGCIGDFHRCGQYPMDLLRFVYLYFEILTIYITVPTVSSNQNKYQGQAHPNALCSLRCCASTSSTCLISYCFFYFLWSLQCGKCSISFLIHQQMISISSDITSYTIHYPKAGVAWN